LFFFSSEKAGKYEVMTYRLSSDLGSSIREDKWREESVSTANFMRGDREVLLCDLKVLCPLKEVVSNLGNISQTRVALKLAIVTGLQGIPVTWEFSIKLPKMTLPGIDLRHS
jgi:hypothetical protein